MDRVRLNRRPYLSKARSSTQTDNAAEPLSHAHRKAVVDRLADSAGHKYVYRNPETVPLY